jgi:hypothetical protein
MEKAVLLFAAVATAVACGRSDLGRARSGSAGGGAGASAPATDAVIARVGVVEIRQSAVLRQMRFSGKPPRAALDELIQFELLALAAANVVSPSDPDVGKAQAAAAVATLIAHEIEPRLGKQEIPDAVLRDVYEKARKAFVHPRLVEVAMLNVYTGARMKDAPRARAAETAKALEQYLRQHPEQMTADGFQALALESAWKDRAVKFSRVWQAIDDPFPQEVGREVQRLTARGQSTPMITAETGFHVSTYIGEQPPKNVSFEEARDQLRDQLYERWRTGRFLELTSELAGGHVIEAFPERLAGAMAP